MNTPAHFVFGTGPVALLAELLEVKIRYMSDWKSFPMKYLYPAKEICLI